MSTPKSGPCLRSMATDEIAERARALLKEAKIGDDLQRRVDFTLRNWVALKRTPRLSSNEEERRMEAWCGSLDLSFLEVIDGSVRSQEQS